MASVNSPTPAIVSQREAQALPRMALWVLLLAYVLPGVIGRDPWRNADLTAYAYMHGMATGQTSWFSPTLGDLPAETALLPYWIGAWSINAFPLDPSLAARLPFACLLALTLGLVWHSTYLLARTEAAQPLPFAFGGEASRTDYARALADGALLAMISTLGLLQLGHETTPELVQLCAVTSAIWAQSAAPFYRIGSPLALLISLATLSASGAPTLSLGLGIIASISCQQSRLTQVKTMWPWIVASTIISALVSCAVGAWENRLTTEASGGDWWGIARQFLWFTWPSLPLAIWTCLRWRSHLSRRHISTPAASLVWTLLACLTTGASDRSLLQTLPMFAILSAFALPTLRKNSSALIDWFSLFFFTITAIAAWVIYSSMQTGWPQQPLRNILRLAPDFQTHFSPIALVVALLGTIVWLALVRWRTARVRHPLWKSLVLSASGLTLAWLLTMTLLLPAIDHGRSPRPMVKQIQKWIPPESCIWALNLSRPNVAGLILFGQYTVHAQPITENRTTKCQYALMQWRKPTSIEQRKSAAMPEIPQGWNLVAEERRPGEVTEAFLILKRNTFK